ncbi:AbrB/MazE/SpoVT family DNA-binding domain-containing protein [Burkholderia gladioli]|uniref:AbrB/MazE/SpoVT family DNA-binding domain-containing protein n=1 Tax=Burkholderia gladioli TaxID=28095 RepID=UPI0016416C63|nr:hypothetical protein [Burkholderia gladioli]
MEETDELQKLIAGITSENLHDEVTFGRPVGREAWAPFDNGLWEFERYPVTGWRP